MRPLRFMIRHDPLHNGLAVLALAVFVARAFIATGYMVAVVDGQAQLVICEAASGGGMAHHAHHHHPGSKGTGDHGDNSACPYALSGGAAPLAALPTLSLSQRVVLTQPAPMHALSVSETPRRYAAARGPPISA